MSRSLAINDRIRHGYLWPDSWSAQDKAKLYRFAKRSAAECAAIIEIAGKLDPALTAEEERKQLERLTAMLIRLARSCES
ncbi:MAG: hypothetical protein A2138_12090 [Deltaproteobacteria bacterium RBG_16_71_12]|nr:MAG: hypothetical protein A2138_12090 [Deltaproteobacteria bacterium RBG_16_71_12]